MGIANTSVSTLRVVVVLRVFERGLLTGKEGRLQRMSLYRRWIGTVSKSPSHRTKTVPEPIRLQTSQLQTGFSRSTSLDRHRPSQAHYRLTKGMLKGDLSYSRYLCSPTISWELAGVLRQLKLAYRCIRSREQGSWGKAHFRQYSKKLQRVWSLHSTSINAVLTFLWSSMSLL